MFTLNYKVLFKNTAYWLELSTVVWPSTGSTSTMIVTFSSFITLPLVQKVFLFSILSVFTLVVFFTAILFRPAFRNLLPRMAYCLSTAALFCSIATYTLTMTAAKPLQHTNELSLTACSVPALAIALSAFHLIGYTNTTNQ